MSQNKRGRPSLLHKIGLERFKAMNKLSVSEISRLVCNHFIDGEEKAKCRACRRAIYRAREQLTQTEIQEKTFAPIDRFEAIPEIQKFIEFSRAKPIKEGNLRSQVCKLGLMWTWIRESGRADLIETQRPIMWTIQHVQYILPKIDERQVGRYAYVQSLRQFFKSANKNDLLNDPLLSAKRKLLRSPKGPQRDKDRFTPREYIEKIRPLLSESPGILLALDLHVTLKCREGVMNDASLTGLKWSNVKWDDDFYGFPMVTISVYESKTSGGTLWEHCPVDLWFADLSARLKEGYEKRTNDRIFSFNYREYLDLFKNQLSQKLGWKIRPHDCRPSAGGWLRDLGLSELAIGEYDTKSGKAIGFTGVGWENAEIYFQYYGKMNPLTIFDREERSDMSMFNGLIEKMYRSKEVRN